tara:strand:- start:409 stop:1074 length:666 start_codon:yes stop_codon:yes gene_type:complete
MDSYDDILPEDVLLETSNVCILKPEVKKGILIFHSYPSERSELIETGLKTNHTLISEGFQTECLIPHKCIFFRAPYQKPSSIDYSSLEREIASVYQVTKEKLTNNFYQHKIWIRVDPRKTNTFSSEIRDIFTYPKHYQKPGYLQNSKKTMLSYFDIIASNRKIIQDNLDLFPIFNLFSSQVVMRKSVPQSLQSPMNKYDVSKHSEVLVEIPHLTPEYFVKL